VYASFSCFVASAYMKLTPEKSDWGTHLTPGGTLCSSRLVSPVSVLSAGEGGRGGASISRARSAFLAIASRDATHSTPTLTRILAISRRCSTTLPYPDPMSRKDECGPRSHSTPQLVSCSRSSTSSRRLRSMMPILCTEPGVASPYPSLPMVPPPSSLCLFK